MERFIPVSEEAERRLHETFAQSPFGSRDMFLKMYNSGLVKRTGEIRDYLDLLSVTYKDVTEKNSKIEFLSPTEVFLQDAITDFEQWAIIAKIQREIVRAVSAGDLSEDEVVVFSPGSVGRLCKVGTNADGQATAVEVSKEKLFTKHALIRPIFDKISSMDRVEGKNVFFRPGDFLGFAERIREQIHV